MPHNYRPVVESTMPTLLFFLYHNSFIESTITTSNTRTIAAKATTTIPETTPNIDSREDGYSKHERTGVNTAVAVTIAVVIGMLIICLVAAGIEIFILCTCFRCYNPWREYNLPMNVPSLRVTLSDEETKDKNSASTKTDSSQPQNNELKYQTKSLNDSDLDTSGPYKRQWSDNKNTPTTDTSQATPVILQGISSQI